MIVRRVAKPVFSGKPEGPFCLSYTFIFRNERNWMRKSAWVSEKLVSPGLPDLQIATRLIVYSDFARFNPRSLERGGDQIAPPSIFLALNFCSLIDCQKLWYNCSLFVNTSFDTS